MDYIYRKINNNKSAIDIFKLFKDLPHSALLDSSLGIKDIGEFSIIVFNPFLIFKSKENNIELKTEKNCRKFKGKPFEHLKTLLDKYKLYYPSEIPFLSGCVGSFSYDAGFLLENLPSYAVDDLDIPDIVLGFYNNTIVFDHAKNETFIGVSSAGLERSENMELILEQKFNYIYQLIKDCNTDENCNLSDNRKYSNKMELTSNFTKYKYCRMIEKAKEYIRNGDIYQANLSQRFKASLNGRHPFEIYLKLRKANPAPFSSYMNMANFKILSSSPERFLKKTGSYIETRPIKGTRPRGETPTEDERLSTELLDSVKDQAEHIMIVDLERNDLGRVCKIGSVEAESLFMLEKYATVLHLVSIVKGTLSEDKDIIDCITAAFPGGSITGAPKIRAMEIIEELEPVKRNIYTGSLGYIGFNGDCDLNIAIRTMIVKDKDIYFNVGGGIVWDSDPEKEYIETLDKGKAMMKVLMEEV